MGQPIPVAVYVGGTLKAEDVDAFCDAAAEEGLGLDWVSGPLEAAALGAWLQGPEGKDALLNLEDPECNYGDVESFLTWLTAHGLPWRYYCDPDCGEHGIVRQWQPDWGDTERSASYDGQEPCIAIDVLAEAKAKGETLDDLIARYTLPAIPPFTVIGHVCWNACPEHHPAPSPEDRANSVAAHIAALGTDLVQQLAASINTAKTLGVTAERCKAIVRATGDDTTGAILNAYIDRLYASAAE